jgi:hypothetical protein
MECGHDAGERAQRVQMPLCDACVSVRTTFGTSAISAWSGDMGSSRETGPRSGNTSAAGTRM